MSENYYIALENPISMDFSTLLLRYMTGRACLAECLKYDPNKRTKIHLIPRPGRSGWSRKKSTLRSASLYLRQLGIHAWHPPGCLSFFNMLHCAVLAGRSQT